MIILKAFRFIFGIILGFISLPFLFVGIVFLGIGWIIYELSIKTTGEDISDDIYCSGPFRGMPKL